MFVVWLISFGNSNLNFLFLLLLLLSRMRIIWTFLQILIEWKICLLYFILEKKKEEEILFKFVIKNSFLTKESQLLKFWQKKKDFLRPLWKHVRLE